ncbi:SV2C protein, partial [Polypterus senegalus]
TGFGLFHGWLLIVCGWANASDAIEILSVSFLLPAARCDLQLTSSDMGFLIASTFLGMAIGGYVWGYLADKNGRQKILAFSLAINGLFAALSSLATTFWLFLLLRFISGVGYYGLWMWLPELFKRQDEGDVSCSITFHQSDTHQVNNESCSPPKRTVFTESLITAGANLPGNIFTIFLMDVLGGRILLVFSLLLSGLSVFFFWAVKTKTQSLVMSCIFSAVSVVSWNALDLIGTELYPTQLRSCALGFFTGVGRLASILANIVFGQLVDTNCAVTLLLVAAMLCIGGLTASRLPHTKHAELM